MHWYYAIKKRPVILTLNKAVIKLNQCPEKTKGFGKTFMITSILFAYGCYGLIYCLYYLQKTSAVADVFLIYYIASLLASLLMSIGLISYYKRFKQLKAIELTRKELQMFFGS